MTGKITYYNADRGIGFILLDDGVTELFLHINNVDERYQDDVHIGKRCYVEETIHGKKLPVGKNITILSD